MSSAEKAKKEQRNQECCKVSEEIKQRAADMEKEIIAERRYFHKHPELSLKETETANALCWRLASMGIEYTRVSETVLSRPSKERRPTRMTQREIRAVVSRCEATLTPCP